MFQRHVVHCTLLVLVMLTLPVVSARAGEAGTVQATQVASSGYFGFTTCAVTTVGGVKCWGRNYGGQLGDGTTLSRGVPVDVVGLASGIIEVATGEYHACAVTTAGEVKCWGRNWSGQLGNGTTTDSHTPVPVTGLTDAVAVTAGYQHTCALTTTGGVMCWGAQSSGVPGWDSSLVPVPVLGLADVVAIAAGARHTCALTSSGEVKCWGRYPHETVTSVPDISNAVAISAGGGDTCAVTASGTVKCWDWHDFLEWPLEVVPGIANADSVAVGSNHTCAVATGAVWCWGYNWDGELGDGTTTERFTPVAVVGIENATAVTVGFRHSCAVTTSGDVECWGDNSYGQLGNGHLPQSAVPVIPRGLDSGVASVAVGDWHNCTLSDSGTAKCWGGNWFGQLGDGSTTSRSGPVPVSGLPDGLLTTIAPGYYHTCAITVFGGVKCWGDNDYGQLGDGTTVDSSTPVDVILGPTDYVKALAIGDFHACVLTLMGDVKCWGSNEYGQLGDGTWADGSSEPVIVASLANDDVTSLAAGFAHTCALTARGDVKCWGRNSSGQVGDGTTLARHTPVTVTGLADAAEIDAASENTCARTASGPVMCWGAGGATGLDEDALTPMSVSGLADVVSVDIGVDHRCVLISTGEVECWGGNTFSQLGDGSTTSSATPVTVQGLDGVVKAISTRAYQTCALNLAGKTQCWGSNHNGELGIGGPLDSLTPVYVVGFGDWNAIFQDGFEAPDS